MTVFIAGATGVLGRATIRHLRKQGHRVLAMVRDRRGEQVVRPLGAEPRPADLFDVRSLTEAAQGADVVIHAATSIPLKEKPKLADWVMNDRIRRQGTEALTEAAGRIGARRYIQQSIVWIARPDSGEPFDEDSPLGYDERLASAIDGERLARAGGQRHGYSVAVLRGGWFYGPDAGHTLAFAELLRRRRLPIIGSGRAESSCIHTDDAGSAFASAADSDLSGTWHIVDDEPAPIGDQLRYFAQLLGAAPPRHIPVWLARLLADEFSVLLMTSRVVTGNARFKRDFGWRPQYPSYREGFRQIVDHWAGRGATMRSQTANAATPANSVSVP
jgi:nucleoside-diphosphate-sugar epimerase